jgi:hypothetical protein
MIEDSNHFLNKNTTAVDRQRQELEMWQTKYTFDDLKFTTGDMNVSINMKAVEAIMDNQNFELVKFHRQPYAKPLLEIGYREPMIQNYTWRLKAHQLIDIFGDVNLKNNFGFDLSTIVGTIKSRAPGTGIPCHKDNYSKVEEISNKTSRWVVALQDWNWGEFCQCDDKIIVGWKAGDCYKIPLASEHLAVNFGIKFRNLITITGDINRTNNESKSSVNRIVPMRAS